MKRILPTLLLAMLLGGPAWAAADTGVDGRVLDIERAWAHINYQMPEDQRGEALGKLEERADAVIAAFPDRVEPRVWKAIVLSSHAAVAGPFSALKMAERARDLLLQAEKQDPTALRGSIPTSLGTLYSKVPGWPLGFGSDNKARAYFRKAMEINPDGLDSNYLYAEFLYDQGEYDKALQHLKKALDAPDRPQRPVADKGRREEARALVARVRSEMGGHGPETGRMR
ncbi:hypothetical protein KBTX_03020 [wastewater metagenome]|uniref:Uncharacterized protein n=2 Tax=unclassified sequences TaxID=12908 RepID=A0A5B8RCX0_9ZZZZ|nr:tetratricopeptide repeat protein [Arhodomonas sp. KWT]QEA06680.1 hypothetical protein KBTEX_03020 [uncultured organism]